MATTAKGVHVDHRHVSKFADDRVNLRRESVKAFRLQVNRLRDKLEEFVQSHPDFGLRKMLLSGSLAKGTALSCLNDIDVALYVSSDSAPSIFDDPDGLLEWLAERIRRAYPQFGDDQVTVQTHTVKISFRGSGLDVEVAPVWYNPKLDPKNKDLGYLINRYTGEPVLTSIPMHLEFVRSRKQMLPTHYAQVIRLVKWWIKEQKSLDAEFRCRSYFAELVCARVFALGADFCDYPEALSSIFTFIVKDQLKSRIAFDDFYPLSSLPPRTSAAIEAFDPVNANNNVVRDYTHGHRGNIVESAIMALDAIDEAQFAVTKSRAVECWRRVLGPSFNV